MQSFIQLHVNLIFWCVVWALHVPAHFSAHLGETKETRAAKGKFRPICRVFKGVVQTSLGHRPASLTFFLIKKYKRRRLFQYLILYNIHSLIMPCIALRMNYSVSFYFHIFCIFDSMVQT